MEDCMLSGKKAIAAFLGIDAKTLGRWITRHRLPVARLGRSYICDPEILRDWLTMQIPKSSRPESDDDVDF